ncbi:MAG: MarR family transcriptional regulator [Rhizobiaceae bacterium]|nr:MarR family transcriptional regulator [Rhizobiaceae bacterium]
MRDFGWETPRERLRDAVDLRRAQWAHELPDLDTEPMAVLGRIWRIANMLAPGIEATFKAFELERGEFDVISTMRRSGPPYRLTPTELYTMLMISSGGLTHRLDRLEKAGLVRREASEADGRSRVVALTEKGIETAERAFRADMAQEAETLSRLPPEDRIALADLLRKLTLAVED